MATTRPLMHLGIGDLEDIFEKQGKNFATLARLKHELSHRQVPRAIALMERVRKAEIILKDLEAHRREPDVPRSTLRLKPRTSEAAPVAAPPKEPPWQPVSEPALKLAPAQQDLLTETQQSLSKLGSGSNNPAVAPAPEITPAKKPASVAEPEAVPQLALEDAYRILKVVAGDSWEKVEAARRKIVLKSSPLVTRSMHSAQAQKLLVDAQMANDAAVVIAARRSGRQ